MSFEEFSIICTTCSSGLKVRDVSAIGQIFACPKCGSMVMVEAPEGMDLSDQPHLEGSDAGESPPPDSPGLQPADWMATSSTAKVGWLGKAIGTLAALLLVGSIGTFAWLKHSKQVAATLDVLATDPSSTVDPANVDDSVDGSTDDSQVGANKDLPTLETETTVEDDSLESISIEDSLASTNPTSDQLVTDDVQVEEVFAEANSTADEQATVSQPEVHSVLGDPKITPSLEPTQEVDASETLTNLATLLHRNGNTSPTGPEDASATSDQTTASEPRPRTALANVHVSPKETKPSHELTELTTTKLQRKIPSARFDRVPLVDFLRAMMQLSGVPVQLEPMALAQTSVQPSTPISIAAIDKSSLEILHLALQPIRLTPVIDGTVVRISNQRIEDDSNRTMSFFIADLQSAGAADLDLATFVRTLVAPETWKGERTVEVTRDQLNVTNSRRVLFEVLAFLEKLRAARGLDARKKLPSSAVAIPPRWSQTNRYLDRPINTNIWQPEPWTDVVKQLESATGLRILVDWKSLGRVGVTPKTEMTLAVRGKLAATVFTDVFDSFDLALVPLRGKDVWLTSEEVMINSNYVEFYPMKELGDEAIAIIEELMLSGKAALEGGSDFAIVLGNASLHRRLVER